MADNNFNIALRVQADLASAQKELQDFSAQLDSTSDAADKSDRAFANAGKATQQFGSDVARVMKDLRDFEAANNGAINSLQDIADQEERVDRLFADGQISLEEYENALQNLDKAEERLSKQTASLAREQEKEARELEKLVGSSNKAAAELRKLDATADALEKAFKDNKISVDQYNSALAGINRRRAEIEATGDAIGRLGLRSRESRSQIITMTQALARGDFADAANSLVRLASNTDKTGSSFLKVAVPIGAAAAAVGAFAAVSYAAFQDVRELENALLITGNAAGLTEASFATISRTIEQSSNATISQAEEITLALARTGKFGSDVIASYGRAIAALTDITGRSADELAKEFAEMDGSIAQWAAKQNETWRFLTAAQYENIRAMEDRGDVEGAQLALSEALNDRYATAVTERIGKIEGAWINIKKAASDYWKFAKDLAGQNEGNDAQLLERRQFQLEQRLKLLSRYGRNPDDDAQVQEYRQEIFDLQSLIRESEQQAQEKTEQARRDAETIAAQQRIRDLSLRADRERQMQAELDKLAKDFEAARRTGTDNPDFSDENRKRLEDDIRKRFADRPDNQTREAENYIKNLEQQAAAAGKTAAEITTLRAAELELTAAQRQRVEAAQAIIDKEKERLAVEKDQKTLADLQIQLYRAQGHEIAATNLEIDQQYGELIERLRARNDTANLDLVNQIIDLEKLKTRLAEAQSEIDKVMRDQQTQEASINAQRESGLITEINARRQIVQLHKQTLAELEKQRPILEEMARQPGAIGEAAARALEAINQQAEKLQGTTNVLVNTITNSLEDGLGDMIISLAKGTESFEDAIKSLAVTVAEAIIRIQAQQFAQALVGQGVNWVGAGISLAASMFSGAGASSSASGVTEGGLVLTASTGGHVTGPGTGTSDSIPAMLSNNEFVARSAVVTQPGALGFLHDFNARGMAALADWSPVHHETGGLAGYPAPTAPAPSAAAAEAMANPALDLGAGKVEIANINVLDPDLLDEYVQSPRYEKQNLNFIKRNSTIIAGMLNRGGARR